MLFYEVNLLRGEGLASAHTDENHQGPAGDDDVGVFL
jgi:hypothetical protein